MNIILQFTYPSAKGTTRKELRTTDTPLLALAKFFSKFPIGTVLSVKAVDGSTAVVEYDTGSLVVSDIRIEGKRGRQTSLMP